MSDLMEKPTKLTVGSLRFYTTEEPPRRLNVRGRSGIDPDVLVADNPDGGKVLWIVDGGDPKKTNCHVCGANYRAIRFPEEAPALTSGVSS